MQGAEKKKTKSPVHVNASLSYVLYLQSKEKKKMDAPENISQFAMRPKKGYTNYGQTLLVQRGRTWLESKLQEHLSK
jgi:hypothetical protein